jgi:hypothetical protein
MKPSLWAVAVLLVPLGVAVGGLTNKPIGWALVIVGLILLVVSFLRRKRSTEEPEPRLTVFSGGKDSSVLLDNVDINGFDQIARGDDGFKFQARRSRFRR